MTLLAGSGIGFVQEKQAVEAAAALQASKTVPLVLAVGRQHNMRCGAGSRLLTPPH